MSDRTGAAAEVFLWIAVALLCVTGVVTVFADDLLSIGRPPATAAPPQ